MGDWSRGGAGEVSHYLQVVRVRPLTTHPQENEALFLSVRLPMPNRFSGTVHLSVMREGRYDLSLCFAQVSNESSTIEHSGHFSEVRGNGDTTNFTPSTLLRSVVSRRCFSLRNLYSANP